MLNLFQHPFPGRPTDPTWTLKQVQGDGSRGTVGSVGQVRTGGSDGWKVAGPLMAGMGGKLTLRQAAARSIIGLQLL